VLRIDLCICFPGVGFFFLFLMWFRVDMELGFCLLGYCMQCHMSQSGYTTMKTTIPWKKPTSHCKGSILDPLIVSVTALSSSAICLSK